MPPLVNLLVVGLSALIWRRWRGCARLLASLSLLSLLLLSLPWTAQQLAHQLERYPPLQVDQIAPQDYQAIVVLGAGRYRNAPEYGGDDIPSALALERLRYAAHLQRQTGLPLMTTGGAWSADRVPEAVLMAQVLEREFRGAVSWQETASRTTWENARYAKQIAEAEGIQRVLLVTHAWHMPRALLSFSRAGLQATPAPTIYQSGDSSGAQVADFIPGAAALQTSTYMLHEMLGLLWYRYGAGRL